MEVSDNIIVGGGSGEEEWRMLLFMEYTAHGCTLSIRVILLGPERSNLRTGGRYAGRS
jgi:hypothetical protein